MIWIIVWGAVAYLLPADKIFLWTVVFSVVRVVVWLTKTIDTK